MSINNETEPGAETVIECETCRHFHAPHRTPGDDPIAAQWGDCRRFPPVALAVGDADYVSVESMLPRTHAGSRCGEWAGRE